MTGMSGVTIPVPSDDPFPVFEELSVVSSSIILGSGVVPCDIVWVVGSSATLGTGTNFAGTIMASASITLNTNVTLDGRAWALPGAHPVAGSGRLLAVRGAPVGIHAGLTGHRHGARPVQTTGQ